MNLVAGERLMPELVQDDATPSSLAAALSPFIGPETAARQTAVAGLAHVRAALAVEGQTGGSAAERVAQLAEELVVQRA